MGVFDMPGALSIATGNSAIGNHIEGIYSALADIPDDLERIRMGVEDFWEGLETAAEGAELISSAPLAGLAGFGQFLVGMGMLIRGAMEAAWGMLQIMAGFAMLMWDLGRILYHTLALGFSVARQVFSITIGAVIALAKSGPGSAIMAILDPMRFGRTILGEAFGVEKVLVENDYVRTAGGKGIVREVLTIPFVGQLATIKLNLGHAYITVPSSSVILLGHVYNIVRF